MLTNLKFCVVSLALFLSGCGSYYHYGLEIGSSKSTLKQDDPHLVTGSYEFESILFVSEDKNLTISVQHPLHSIPEPEKFISQIEINLKDGKKNSFLVHSISFNHQSLNGEVIEPVERKKLRNSFYVHIYNKSQLTENLKENINIHFSYKGTRYSIAFSEIVKKVKRWSKLTVLLNS